MRLRSILIPALCIVSSAAYAASASGTLADRYQRALRDLEANRLNETQTRAERDRLAGEAQSLQPASSPMQAKCRISNRLPPRRRTTRAPGENERVLLADLNRDRDRVAHLLAGVAAALCTGRRAALRPDDSLAAARGTMQLGVMLPPSMNSGRARSQPESACRHAAGFADESERRPARGD